jgi:nucleoside-diphosphate-sugar epimerase
VTRVLVSGAGGFVGLPVLARLAQADAEVHALHTRPQPPVLEGVHWHRLDLADPVALEQVLAELAPERLVHLAWYTEHGRFWHAPENVLWVERSLRLLRAFVRHGGQRLVMLGTCAEYDWELATGRLVEHSSPLAPTTLYGVAKDALRRLAGAYTQQAGVELAWGRLFLLYGPREAPGRLVASVIRSLLAEAPVAIGSPGRVRDLLHVEDAAGAVVALLDSTVVGAVNIASGVEVTVGEVVERIARLLGRPELVCWEALLDRRGEPPLLAADVARLHDEVGFRPRLGLDEGLAATVRWWQEQGQR